MSIYLNGVKVASSERTEEVKKNKAATSTTLAHLTGLLTGEAIEVYWRTDKGNTLTDQQRTLVVSRID